MKKMTLNELRNEEVRVLSIVHDFCQENKLKYSMAGGTLLGAVRHHGFIPWDDDIDIVMPRKDYEILKKYFQLERRTDVKLFHYDLVKNYPYPFMKLASTRSYIDEKELRDEYKKCRYGAWVDIFPMDFIENKLIYKKKINLIKKINFLIFKRVPTHTISRCFQSQIEYIKKKIYPSLHTLLEKLDKDQCYKKTNFTGCDIWGYGEREIVPTSIWDDLCIYDFEEKKFFGFANDIYLHSLYGDYMKLPPINDRKPHFMDAYWL